MTDISALEAYTGQLSEAAAMATAAAQTQKAIVNGDASTDVPTESGLVPSLAKQAVLAQDKVTASLEEVASQMAGAMTYGSTALGLLGTNDGGYFSVPSPDANESLIMYRNAAGVAVEEKRYPSTKVSLSAQKLPGLAWSVGDDHGSHPLRLGTDGVTAADSLRAGLLSAESLVAGTFSLGGSEYLKAMGIQGVVMALLDSLGGAAWLTRENGKSYFAAIEAGELSIGGVDILQWLTGGNSARASDRVMGPSGLVPMYANMTKISGWGSSSLEYMLNELIPVLSEVAPTATYYNGAKGGETARGIAGRLGAIPILLSVSGGVIPASGPVSATSSNVAPNSSMRSFTGMLSGVLGALSSNGTTFTFTRSAAGADTVVADNTAFLPIVGPQYRDGVALLWMGKNDIAGTSDSAAVVAGLTDTCFDYFTPFVKRLLVLGHFGNSSWAGNPKLTTLLETNALHAARYGAQYIDVLGYLNSAQVWVDTAIAPTAADLTAQANNCLAPSLTPDGMHFNPALNVAFCKFLKTKIENLGWF